MLAPKGEPPSERGEAEEDGVPIGWSLAMAGIPPGPLLLVSPHLDDAVFSCSAIVERAETVDVLTVCAGSPDPPRRGSWDEQCGFSSSAESMPVRLREDEAAFAGTPHRRRYLTLLDMQFVDWRTEEEATTIAAEIAFWLATSPNGTVALPAGAGCQFPRIVRRVRRAFGRPCDPPPHPDHLYVRNAALPALRDSPPSQLLLYEELPYLFGGRADGEASRIAAEGGWELEPIVTPIDPSEKARRIAAYATQVLPLSSAEARLDDPATLPPEERYWLLRRSSTSP
jgi:LmbE family N-acetylglucosaminyl deacetylase